MYFWSGIKSLDEKWLPEGLDKILTDWRPDGSAKT
jgi:hypothetical protein